MSTKRLLNWIAPLLAAGVVALGLGACGSDDDDGGGTTVSGNDSTAPQSKPAEQTGQRDDKPRDGQIKPKRKAPKSAGDRDGNAPDDVISKRPGGPGDPAKP